MAGLGLFFAIASFSVFLSTKRLMAVEWHLIFAFLSSLLYVGGALLIKRAADLGTGLWRTNFLCNMVTLVG